MKLPFFASLSAVVCGAAFGAAARWLLALWLDTPDQPFSRATLSANWIGALLIGLAAGLGRQPAGPAAVLEIVADNRPAWQPDHFFRFFTRNRCHAATTTLFRRRTDHPAAPRRLAAFTASGLFLVRLLHHRPSENQPLAGTLYFALALRSICIYICEHY